MLNVRLFSAFGKKRGLKVNPEGTVGVVVHGHPPLSIDEPIQSIPFRQYFTLNGDGATTDMRVAGSSSDIKEFYIEASPDFDIYIKTCSIIISDQNANLNQFGAIAALTNGVEFRWSTQDLGAVVINESLKTNFDFVRLGQGTPAIGNTTSSFRASNVSGNSEGYIPFLDLTNVFGLTYGLRLRKGTKDKLMWCVKDNTSTIDAFNIIGYGQKI